MAKWERVYKKGGPAWAKPARYVVPYSTPLFDEEWERIEAKRAEAIARRERLKAERALYVPRNLLTPGYLHRGYGGSERWPFSIARALKQRGYRRGILRALDNPAYSGAWRHQARIDMETIVGPRMEEEVWNGSETPEGLKQFLYELEEEEERKQFMK